MINFNLNFRIEKNRSRETIEMLLQFCWIYPLLNKGNLALDELKVDCKKKQRHL